MPRVHPGYRWYIIACLVVGLALRVVTRHWDPSLFIQLVFTVFGFAFTSQRETRGRDALADDPVAKVVTQFAVILIGAVLALSGWLTVTTFAPLAVAVIALGWTIGLRRFGGFLFVIPLLTLVPIAIWFVAMLRVDDVRGRFLAARGEDIASASLAPPDGLQQRALDSNAQRGAVASLLHRMQPLYPNHEGITDAWTLDVVLRSGEHHAFRVGHGNRSRSYAWIAWDNVNDFYVPDALESVIAALSGNTAGSSSTATTANSATTAPRGPVDAAACEASVRAACGMAAVCAPPGGRINLWIPDDHGGPGSVSFFSRAEECIPSYLGRQCRQGGFACAVGPTPQCIDLDVQRYGVARAVAVPVSCAGAFHENR